MPDKWQFSLHYYRFHKEKTLKCDNCEKHFGHTSLLKVHFERCSKNYKCDNCVKTFRKKYRLKNHMKKCDTKIVQEFKNDVTKGNILKSDLKSIEIDEETKSTQNSTQIETSLKCEFCGKMCSGTCDSKHNSNQMKASDISSVVLQSTESLLFQSKSFFRAGYTKGFRFELNYDSHD